MGKKLRVSPKGWILASEKKLHDADDFPSAGFHKILPGNFISEGWQNHGTVLLRAISRGCTQLVEGWRQNCANTIRRKMVDKVMRMAYDKDEQPSTLDEMGKIQAGEGGNGGIDDQLNSVYLLLQYLFQCLFSLLFLGGMIWRVVTVTREHNAIFLGTGILLIAAGIGIMWFQVRNNQKSQEKILQIRKTEETLREVNPLEWGLIMGKTGAENTLLGTLLSLISYAYVAVCAWVGIFPIGNVLLYASSMERFTDAVQQFLREYSQYCYRFAYLKTYADFINSDNMLYDGTLPVEKRDDGQYEFELKDVSFSYPGTEQRALDHVNLKFTVGKHYALVGQNGSGKSTLIALLCRLYEPTEGQILLNGIPIGLYDYQGYTDIFSVVFQDYHLFAAPVSENVAAGSEVDRERLRRSLKEAGALQWVERNIIGRNPLPGGRLHSNE